jgi:NDP-sugar pyrophosphorylase family protein
MKAVILAGGLGTRLRPFTEVIPKPLLPVGEHSLMEVQILSLARHGFEEIFVATNYKSEYVEAYLGDGSKYNVKLTFSKEEKRLGTCGPLTLLKDRLTEPFIMMNGDILTKNNFLEMYSFGMKQDSMLTIGTKMITHPFRFGNVRVGDDNLVKGVEEKPELVFEILAGIYFFKPGIFSVIPEDTYFGMDDLIHKMLAESLPITRYAITEYWLDIGQVEDYTKAKEEYAKLF